MVDVFARGAGAGGAGGGGGGGGGTDGNPGVSAASRDRFAPASASACRAIFAAHSFLVPENAGVRPTTGTGRGRLPSPLMMD